MQRVAVTSLAFHCMGRGAEMRHYPPAHVIHEANCPDAPAGAFAFRASVLKQAYPNSRPHTCFDRETVTGNREVVAESPDWEAHVYRPSTIHPPDAVRALCEVCRGTHGEPETRPTAAGANEHWR